MTSAATSSPAIIIRLSGDCHAAYNCAILAAWRGVRRSRASSSARSIRLVTSARLGMLAGGAHFRRAYEARKSAGSVMPVRGQRPPQ
jgi:hypothetical protein